MSNSAKLIDILKKRNEVFICGPSFGAREGNAGTETHLRVYAYGGYIAGIPTTKNGGVKRFSKTYVKYANDKSAVESILNADKKDVYGKYIENIEAVLEMVRNRYISESGEKALERNQQSFIANKFMQITGESMRSICECECCMPNEWYKWGLDALKNDLKFKNNAYICSRDVKKPEFDFIMIELPENEDGRAGICLIELKTDIASCREIKGEKRSKTGKKTTMSDLKGHAIDMLAAEHCSLDGEGNIFVKEILRRYRIMCDPVHGLMDAPPARLTELIDHFRHAPDKVDIKKCFLFVGKELSKEFVVEQCRSQLSQLGIEDMYFLRVDKKEDVDLGKFRKWDEFCKL